MNIVPEYLTVTYLLLSVSVPLVWMQLDSLWCLFDNPELQQRRRFCIK